MSTRVFTRPVGSRFARGDLRDYGPRTWQQIATSVGQPLDAFTRPADEAARRAVSLDSPATESAPPARGRPRGKE